MFPAALSIEQYLVSIFFDSKFPKSNVYENLYLEGKIFARIKFCKFCEWVVLQK